MQIAGIQKLTTIDYPGKLACVIFLFGCNFRCGFCHNPSLVLEEKREEVIPKEKVMGFLEKRKNVLEGVCISGGEPLINYDLPIFLRDIKNLGYKIKLDTNGTNPEMLKRLIDEGLIDFIAMDLKSSKENYEKVVGGNVDIKKIEESIKIILSSGITYEFRTTCLLGLHDKEEIEKIGKWIFNLSGKRAEKYFLQKFIPRDKGLVNEDFCFVKEMKKQELEELKEVAENYFESVGVRE